MSEETQAPKEEATPSQKGTVSLTLFILALGFALILMGLKGTEGNVGRLLLQDHLYNQVFGNMHPLVLHLPIGIVFLTVVMECLGWISFGKYRPITNLGLFFAIITGAIACVTGFVSMHNGKNPNADVWNDHMWAGIAFVGLLSLAFLARIWRPQKGSRNPVYAVFLFAAAGVMGYGSHLAGEEIHGPTGVENIINELSGKKTSDTQGNAGDPKNQNNAITLKEPKDRLAYAEVIVPIFENRCLQCHAQDTKDEGDLLMDTWEHLIAGGKSMPDFPTLIPGNTKDSYMVELLFLDEDDDELMPPPSKKREPMPAFEREIIKWWVGALPEGNTLDDQTLAEMNAPAEILEAVSKLISP